MLSGGSKKDKSNRPPTKQADCSTKKFPSVNIIMQNEASFKNKFGRRIIMNELVRTAITSMEVAHMVDKKHADLLKDIRRYVGQLAEGKISSGDFFTENTYLDSNNQSRPCFLVTKKGCEFIAHKMTGQKGTEFTARYINRFHEMENEQKNPSTTEIPVGEVASYLKALDRVAVRQNLAPYKIAENFKKVSEQFGIQLTADFVKVPGYEQMTLDVVAQ